MPAVFKHGRAFGCIHRGNVSHRYLDLKWDLYCFQRRLYELQERELRDQEILQRQQEAEDAAQEERMLRRERQEQRFPRPGGGGVVAVPSIPENLDIGERLIRAPKIETRSDSAPGFEGIDPAVRLFFAQ